MTLATTYQRMSDSWALCGAGKSLEGFKEHARKARERAARSKTHSWGPTHSYDSEDNVPEGKNSASGWWPSPGQKAASETFATPGEPSDLKRSTGTNSTKSSDSSPKESPPPTDSPLKSKKWTAWPHCHQDTTVESDTDAPKKSLMDYVDEVCTPFHPKNLARSTLDRLEREPALGICRMEPPVSPVPNGSGSFQTASNVPGSSSTGPLTSVSTETAADRRRQRYLERQQRSGASITRTLSPHEDFEVTSTQVIAVPPKQEEHTSNNGEDCNAPKKAAPLDNLTLDKQTAVELERSISELTMRSSYGVATAKLSENRRMAYYAVGKHHRQSGRGGNRRCYFTGKLILSDAPFYAGSVQQGLRTLVVFCLPSSLGLPKGREAAREGSSVPASVEGASLAASRMSSPSKSTRSILSSRKNSKMTPSSKMSYMDEMSLSVGEELDPNWGLDKEYLLGVLPDPNQELLDEMACRFPEQFETLPVQVRNPLCWRLYVKFCFFSGLPIAEGELHYQVRDEVADNFGEEVILSHEVMEAVNGLDSAEILRLPNLKTFRYLRKHYSQQSAKLPDEVFQRKSWEMVRPEV